MMAVSKIVATARAEKAGGMSQITVLRSSRPIMMATRSLFGVVARQAKMNGPVAIGRKMPRFAANLAYLFTERPLIERFGAAAAAGFTAVELQFPYDHAAGAVKAEIERHGLTQLEDSG